MKKILFLSLVACLIWSMFITIGYTENPVSAKEAIQQSQTFKTVQEKAQYLIQQAQSFYKSKEFQQAIETAQYVLNKIDPKSKQALDLIEKAKVRLQANAQKAVGDLKNKFLGNK